MLVDDQRLYGCGKRTGTVTHTIPLLYRNDAQKNMGIFRTNTMGRWPEQNVKHLKSMSKTNSHVPPSFLVMAFSCKLIFAPFETIFFPSLRVFVWIYKTCCLTSCLEFSGWFFCVVGPKMKSSLVAHIGRAQKILKKSTGVWRWWSRERQMATDTT